MNTKIPLFKDVFDVYSILNFLPESQEVVELCVNPFLNGLISKFTEFNFRSNLLYDYFSQKISKHSNFLEVQDQLVLFFNTLFLPDLKDEDAVKNFPSSKVGEYFYNNFKRYVNEVFGNPNIENFAFQVLKSCGGNFVAKVLKKYLKHFSDKLENYLHKHRTLLRMVFPDEIKEEKNVPNSESTLTFN